MARGGVAKRWSGPGFTAPCAEALADVVEVHPLLALGLAGRGPFGAVANAHRVVPLRGARRRSEHDQDVLAEDWPVIGAGTGPIGRSGRPKAVPPALFDMLRPQLAKELLTSTLHPLESQILDVCAVYGSVTPERLDAETEGLSPDEADRVVRRLTTLGVLVVVGGSLSVDIGFAELHSTPAPSLAEEAAGITSAQLDTAARLLGRHAGTRKDERLAAVREVLLHRDSLLGALGQLGEPPRALFAAILEATLTGGPVHLSKLGIGYVSVTSTAYRRGDSVVFGELLDRCLVGFSPYDQVAWVWLEAVVGLLGAVHPTWDAPRRPEPRPADDGGAAAMRRVLAVVDGLLDQLATKKLDGRKTGSNRPPVKAVRTLATSLGTDEVLVNVVLDAMIAMGIVRPVLVTLGRRGASPTIAWATDPEARATWSARSAAERWNAVVQLWVATRSLAAAELMAATERHLVLAELRAAPEGTGYGFTAFAAWFAERYPVLGSPLDSVLPAAVALGLVGGDVSGEGVVGLTALGRAAALGADAVGELAGEADATFTLQADHTLIAPPGLDPVLVATLGSIADLESDAGALVYRLSATRIATAAQHQPVEELLAFLAEHSTVGVPGVVERFVRDSAARARRLEVSDAVSVLVADDPLALADALGVKTARLTQVAPTVATSTLTAAKLREVLAAKGVVTAGVDADPVVTAPSKPRRKGSYLEDFVEGGWAPDWFVRDSAVDTPDMEVQRIGIGPEETVEVLAKAVRK